MTLARAPASLAAVRVNGSLPARVQPGRRIGLFRRLSCMVMLTSTPSRAEPASSLSIEADTCPSQELVEEQLLPLLDRRPSDATPGGAELVRVQDLGGAYRIEVGAAIRQAEDPARDCLERARVAAVFIALNLQSEARPPAPAAAKTPSPPPIPKPALPAPPPEPRPSPRVGWQAWGQAAAAPTADVFTVGAGLGMSVHQDPWLVTVRAGAHAPTDLELDAPSLPQARVSVLRIPATLAAGPLWELGFLEIGPTAGIAIDGLWLRGAGVERAASSFRLNLGATLGVEARWPAGLRWLVFSTFHAAAFPREYRLVVEPAGTTGRSPRLWMGLALGIGWESR